MKLLRLALLLGAMVSMPGVPQQTNEDIPTVESRQSVYLVSSRPLASYYSHPLSAELVKNTTFSLYAMYITLGYGDTGTSSQRMMHSVALEIQRVDPSMIIIDEIDAAPYLLTLLPGKYKNVTYFISRNTVENIPRSRLFRVRNLGIEITDFVGEMNLFPDTYYILYDSSGLTAKDSYNLRKTLKGITGSAQAIEISTVNQLDDVLIDLNKRQRSVIINNMTSIKDNEFNGFVKTAKIKEIVGRRNRKHLTIGLNYLPDIENEAVVFQVDYNPIVNKFLTGLVDIDDMWPLPFKIYVDKSVMSSLGYKNNYIAAHEAIDVIME